MGIVQDWKPAALVASTPRNGRNLNLKLIKALVLMRQFCKDRLREIRHMKSLSSYNLRKIKPAMQIHPKHFLLFPCLPLKLRFWFILLKLILPGVDSQYPSAMNHTWLLILTLHVDNHKQWISWSHWPFQDPIYWRYLPYVRLMFKAHVLGLCKGISPPNMAKHIVHYLTC